MQDLLPSRTSHHYLLHHNKIEVKQDLWSCQPTYNYASCCVGIRRQRLEEIYLSLDEMNSFSISFLYGMVTTKLSVF